MSTRQASVSVETILSQLEVPRDITRLAVKLYATRTALITPQGSLTYAQLQDRILRLSSGLAMLGLSKGDHIFTLLPDGSEQIEVRLAGYEMGSILTSFHQAHAQNVILKVAQMVFPSAFIYDPRLVNNEFVQQLSEASPGIITMSIGSGEGYETLIAEHAPVFSENRVSAHDLAGLGFTSGTTGEPKGMQVTQGIFLTSLRLMTKGLERPSSPPAAGQQERFLVGIPLIGAGSGIVLPSLLAGFALIIPPEYTATSLLHMIRTHQATRLFTTPSLLIDLLDWPDLTKADIPLLQNVIYGTESMAAAKLEEAIRRFGPIFQQGYGMAEVLPPVTLLNMADHVQQGKPAPRRILTSAGRVASEVTVQVVDTAEHPLPPGEIGQIRIAGPTVFTGYWRRPDLTAQTLRGGWLYSGDYGYFDEDGLLHILNRQSDVIRQNGVTIYPRQVEEIIHEHPVVKEACLVGVGAPPTTVMCVSLRRRYRREPDVLRTLTQELRQYLVDRVHPWQVPDEIRICDELPRSFLAKVLRREVRQVLTAQITP